MNLPLSTGAQRHASTSLVSRRGQRCGQVLAEVYRLEECIGQGGMGEVYAAEHLRLGRRLAVKILHLDHAQRAAQRFRREARAIAQVSSEFVVSVVDCGELEDETPYLVMELLQGQDLRHLLDAAGPLPVPRAARLVWEACQGLAAVHDTCLIHRDLKPENLFVTQRETGEDWCKVLDFGVAKQQSSSSTVEGALVGTVRYMAPEQLQDATSVGPRSDVYALGAILYECLAGRSPHVGSSIHDLMFKIMNEDAPSVLEVRPEVPAALAQTIARCLDRTAEQRFGTARALASALAPFWQRSADSSSWQRADTECTEELESHAAPSVVARPHARWRTVPFFVWGLLVGAVLAGFALRQPAVAPRKEPAAGPASAAAVQPPTPLKDTEIPPLSSVEARPPSSVEAPPSRVKSTVSSPSAKQITPGIAPSPSGKPVVLRSMVRFDPSNPY